MSKPKQKRLRLKPPSTLRPWLCRCGRVQLLLSASGCCWLCDAERDAHARQRAAQPKRRRRCQNRGGSYLADFCRRFPPPACGGLLSSGRKPVF
jgi:hypothetical protein